MNWKFEVGQHVRKVGGYPFPGIVEGRFLLTQIDGSRAERYLVNQTTLDAIGKERMTGLGHIFSPAQLEIDDRYDSNGERYDADAEAADSQIPVRVPKGDKGKQADPRLDADEAVRRAHAAVLARQGLKEEDKP